MGSAFSASSSLSSSLSPSLSSIVSEASSTLSSTSVSSSSLLSTAISSASKLALGSLSEGASVSETLLSASDKSSAVVDSASASLSSGSAKATAAATDAAAEAMKATTGTSTVTVVAVIVTILILAAGALYTSGQADTILTSLSSTLKNTKAQSPTTSDDTGNERKNVFGQGQVKQKAVGFVDEIQGAQDKLGSEAPQEGSVGVEVGRHGEVLS